MSDLSYQFAPEVWATADAVRDEIDPPAKWAFDDKVTDAFDDMLQRSIPQYTVMRELSADLAAQFARQDGLIVDLGTSRGEALASIIARRSNQNQYLGLEVSAPMVNAARKRFYHYQEAKFHIQIDQWDLRQGLPDIQANVVLSILTLQFTPIEYRLMLLKEIYTKLEPGGLFVFVEKVLGATDELDKVLVRKYYSLKSENGYSDEQIERKRLALEGVLVPLTALWNEQMMHDAGFRQVECFWRWLNFAGWIGIK